MSNATFKQLPIDGLLTTWRNKLPPDIAEAYVQMGRIIADRDLNLAVLFNELVSTAASVSGGILYVGDQTADGSWRLVVQSTALSVQRRESSTWVEKFSFTA